MSTELLDSYVSPEEQEEIDSWKRKTLEFLSVSENGVLSGEEVYLEGKLPAHEDEIKKSLLDLHNNGVMPIKLPFTLKLAVLSLVDTGIVELDLDRNLILRKQDESAE
jgi:hypothetical protein